MNLRRPALAALLACSPLIAACDGPGTSSGPGAVSEGEARALDEAAEMLEERNLPEGVLPPTNVEGAPGEAGDEASAADTSMETGAE